MESRLIRSWGDYFYPGTTVLRNRFGETDAERLRQKEDFATHVRLAELASQPIRGEFDYTHMKAIHRAIFQDVYDWAGERELLRQMHHSSVSHQHSRVEITSAMTL